MSTKLEDQWSCKRSPEICYICQQTCLNIMVFSPSAGADEAIGPFVFRIINILSICQFLFYLFPYNDMLTVRPLIPIQMHWQPMLTLSSNTTVGQGHHRVMIYIHIVVLEPSMLHAKFHCNQSTGSGGDDF